MIWGTPIFRNIHMFPKMTPPFSYIFQTLMFGIYSWNMLGAAVQQKHEKYNMF